MEIGTVLPSPLLAPPLSWLPWHHKAAPREVDSLIGSMFERSWRNLLGEISLAKLLPHRCNVGSINKFHIYLPDLYAPPSTVSYSALTRTRSNYCLPGHNKPSKLITPSTYPPTSPALAICLLDQPRYVCVYLCVYKCVHVCDMMAIF